MSSDITQRLDDIDQTLNLIPDLETIDDVGIHQATVAMGNVVRELDQALDDIKAHGSHR